MNRDFRAKHDATFQAFRKTGGKYRVLPHSICAYLPDSECFCVSAYIMMRSLYQDHPDWVGLNFKQQLWKALYELSDIGMTFEHLWFEDQKFMELKFEDGYVPGPTQTSTRMELDVGLQLRSALAHFKEKQIAVDADDIDTLNEMLRKWEWDMSTSEANSEGVN